MPHQGGDALPCPHWLPSIRLSITSRVAAQVALGANTPRDTPLWKMMAAGGIAGGIASFIANPTDLLKTRMQVMSMADG